MPTMYIMYLKISEHWLSYTNNLAVDKTKYFYVNYKLDEITTISAATTHNKC